ncbi:hypothetical protein [Saccharolobus islandicus]|uniref:Uncharacterized protein n=1 Tax=Saccharolobus islandicus (strain M.16.4 / Kamchatka \|nr:hypothetical protein [Sulfolobus islandicus]ACR40782.1 hypothetical protein M164_0148 [Sulfolobus islandicus M.16.4]
MSWLKKEGYTKPIEARRFAYILEIPQTAVEKFNVGPLTRYKMSLKKLDLIIRFIDDFRIAGTYVLSKKNAYYIPIPWDLASTHVILPNCVYKVELYEKGIVYRHAGTFLKGKIVDDTEKHALYFALLDSEEKKFS